MAPLRVFTSGDPIADRRASFAETLLHLGDVDGALQALEAALELVPDWIAGWFRLGEWRETAGQIDAAVEAWGRVLELDPTDALGAGLKRDLARKIPLVESMPPAFVELLFDQYAPRFERSLTGGLGYDGPDQIMAALENAGFEKARRAIDLGCGTGLVGTVLRARCDWLAGYDISNGMLSEARDKGIYDYLEKRDIAQMPVSAERFDLIVAADVFIYIGALERVIGWCAGSLEPGGFLAFTVELGDLPVVLQDSQRFAHSRQYVETLLQDAGLTGVMVMQQSIRQDRGVDVPGLVVVARLLPAEAQRLGDGEFEAFA